MTELLNTAGCAINVLSGQPIQQDSLDNEMQANESTLENRKRQFLHYTTGFFAKVKKISEDLVKQADSLEDAGIIFVEQSQWDVKDDINNGGFGNLDIGMLNARINDPGVLKEAEIYDEAVSLLKNLKDIDNQQS